MDIALQLSTPQQHERRVFLPLRWQSDINKVVWVQSAVYGIYLLLCGVALVSESTDIAFVNKVVRDYVALPGNARERVVPWLAGLVTHPFAHLSPLEFVVSTCAFWLSGHLLKEIIGERKVVILYFLSTLAAALMFLFAHEVFPVFSGYGTVMQGALPGALGVFTMSVIMQHAWGMRIGLFTVRIWHLYTAVVIVALTILNQPSIASILMYLGAIWIGLQYGARLLMKREMGIDNK